MTEQPDQPDEEYPEPDEEGTEELETDEVPDESVVASDDAAHPEPTEAELAEGQRLGEEIDTEDDDDTGIPEESDE